MKTLVAAILAMCGFLCGFHVASAQPNPDLTAPAWHQVALITAQSRRAGVTVGGEGGQAIRSLEISPSDPKFLMMGTDVGGIYRTLDGGKYWQVCMVGWHSRGSNGFAIDPDNPKRVLGFGSNSSDWNSGWGTSPDGIYLSTSQGASWRQVMPSTESNQWRCNILAFDPSSYNRQLGYCTTAYYASRDSGLYKTVDGGVSWSLINKSLSGGQLKVNSVLGWVYLAQSGNSDHGLYRSKDGGVTFQKLNDEKAVCIDVVATHPDWIWIGGPKKVLFSRDDGDSFRSAGIGTGMPNDATIANLRVSPVNPKNMIAFHGGDQWWQAFVYSTRDGGSSWKQVSYDDANHFLPITQPGNRFQFSPVDANVAYGETATGCVMLSVDGGCHYVWHNNGENAVMSGSSFNFSSEHPNQVFLSFQDFDSAVSQNAGGTWRYLNPAGNTWGGYEYGGSTSDGVTIWTGDAPGWTGLRTLKVSFDRGLTWSVAKDSSGNDIHFEGADVSYTDPVDSKTLFASNWRSTDGGKTWTRMTGCDGVYTSDPKGDRKLIGRHGHRVAVSADHGATWTDVTTFLVGGDIKDVAYDQVRKRYYVASDDHVKYFDGSDWYVVSLPKDFHGATHAWSVAVDPTNPSVVYAAGPSNTCVNDATIVGSTDAGHSWFNLTVTQPLSTATERGGPHEVSWVRVDPATRDLWAAGECYGFWKIGTDAVASYAIAAVKTKGEPSLIPKVAPITLTLRNGDMSEGTDKPTAWDGIWSNVVTSRDTTVFKSAPASFKVDTDGQKAQGSGYQSLDGIAGTSFTVSGSIKSKGATAQASIQSFDSNWHPINFQQVKWIPPDTDWTDFSGKVTLPDGAMHFTVVLLVDGNGSGWLDDVKLTDIVGP